MSSTPLPPSPDLLLSGLQQGINRLLVLDPDSRAAMAELGGKTIAIEVTRPAWQVFVVPGEQGIALTRERPKQVDVAISGRPDALLGMVLGSQNARSQGHVEIRGDIHLAQRLQQILKSLDVDWEEWIAGYTGDMVAHRLGHLGRELRRHLDAAGRSLALQFSEYLHYEQRLLPLRDEIDQFIEEVDGLRDDVERMSQRLERLERFRGGRS